MEEAILIGKAVNMNVYLLPKLSIPANVVIADENIVSIIGMSKLVVEKLEAALILDPTNFLTLYVLFLCCSKVYRFLLNHKQSGSPIEGYSLKMIDYSYKLLDHSSIEGHEKIKINCCYELACMFCEHLNHSAAHKYAKLAYEHCLRSADSADLSTYKNSYLKYRADFAKLPPLRFAVGDEVEFLHELETGSEWKPGRVVELYYWERGFATRFNAPYLLQLLGEKEGESPVYAWVKADSDRYVRKVGVRSIEDTRYQARLNSKVMELARVYCSKEFIESVYSTLAQDRRFVLMLRADWQVVFSETMLNLYRLLVMYRRPLVRTDTGYHIPLTEEVIAGIRAFFDPAHLSRDAADASAVGENGDSQRARADILTLFRGTLNQSLNFLLELTPHEILLLQSVKSFFEVLSWPDLVLSTDLLYRDSDFTVPVAVSEAISRVSTARDLISMHSEFTESGSLWGIPLSFGSDASRFTHYLAAWIGVHRCLENPDAGPACECPFVYFFVKFCLDHNLGVPKLALTMYDRMNMQLSKEFIRCANPTCGHNKLDQSTGEVKFKKCSRCKAVIYCSRECQVAHYPDHKRLCIAHSTR